MSKSKVKLNISADVISDIFKRHSLAKVLDCSELKGGTFNSVFKVHTEDGSKYVIKIAPDKNTEVLTYEKDLIMIELFVYELLQNTKYVHFPEIYGYNYDDDYQYKYLIMEFIEGKMFCDLRLDKNNYNRVMFDLGKAIAEIHSVTGENGFGYIQNNLKCTMKEAYLSMVNNIIKDGLKKTKHIPYRQEIIDIIDKYIYVFDSVKTPVLLHFDLWAGNVIIKDDKFYALIDCERAMYAVAEGDFISLDYVAPFDVEANKSLIDGYNSVAKNKVKFDKESLIRFYLMKIYLGLIIYVETYYRTAKSSVKFFGRKRFGKKVLKITLKQLKNLS